MPTTITLHKLATESWQQRSRYAVRRDGRMIGKVASSITSTSALSWSTYGVHGTRPTATGFASRAAAVADLRVHAR